MWQHNRSVGTGKYSGTCPIRHTKGPGKCVGLYRILEYSGFILVDRNTLGSGKCVGLYRISEYSSFILVDRNTLGP
jgi:hypothetical protein